MQFDTKCLSDSTSVSLLPAPPSRIKPNSQHWFRVSLRLSYPRETKAVFDLNHDATRISGRTRHIKAKRATLDEDGTFGKLGCGGWICSRTYQVGVETTRLGWLRGPPTSVVFTLTMRLFRSVSVVAEACRTDFAADADLMGASSKTISMPPLWIFFVSQRARSFAITYRGALSLEIVEKSKRSK